VVAAEVKVVLLVAVILLVVVLFAVVDGMVVVELVVAVVVVRVVILPGTGASSAMPVLKEGTTYSTQCKGQNVG
jgi:sensor histidine kinase YesM